MGKFSRHYQGRLSYTEAAIALIIGMLPLLFLPKLPDSNRYLVLGMMLLVVLIIIWCNKPTRFLAVMGMGFLWACWHGVEIRKEIDFLSGVYRQWDITIVSIPLNQDDAKKRVRVDRVDGTRIFPALYASWNSKKYAHEKVCAGQQWRITGKLNPVHASLNEGGFDQQRHLISQKIIGTLKAKQAEQMNGECALRQKIIDRFSDTLSTRKNDGIIYALMFGERGWLSAEHTQLLQSTGLTHLIAISGLHMGIAYLIGYSFARLLQFFFPVKWIGENLPLFSGVVFALLYAWLSNFAIPATRAVFALLLWIYVRKQPFLCFPWQWALWSIAGILLFDPLAILSDSFWLSSFAVLAILYWFRVFPISSTLSCHPIMGKIAPLIHLQIGLLILLIPIQVLLFNGINVMSLFANLWFVPLITWGVVPVIFSTLLLPVSAWHNVAFELIDSIIEFGLKPLPYLSGFWIEINAMPIYTVFFCWAFAFIILFGWYKNYLGLLSCIGILLFFTKHQRQHAEHDWCLTLLDIGHGLAVVMVQNQQGVLYDTGNRWDDGSNAKRQIIPFLKHHQITPINVILSHNHLDHTGGTSDLIEAYPWLSLRSSFGQPNHLPCHQGQRWQWGKLHFEVLWPEKLAEISHNNDSCVIQVSDGYRRLLFTGDLEKQGEKRLALQSDGQLKADILFVPHHGSNTSSTPLFIRKVQPTFALVSSARYSPWKIPSDKVYLRYAKKNIQWLNTAEEGQVTICFNKEKMEILRYRKEINPRWYHLWFGVSQFPL
ncbi:TPA: DNA internalization-related competence protein ComEC/Rec2 [Providencia alcalifaciens]